MQRGRYFIQEPTRVLEIGFPSLFSRGLNTWRISVNLRRKAASDLALFLKYSEMYGGVIDLTVELSEYNRETIEMDI